MFACKGSREDSMVGKKLLMLLNASSLGQVSACVSSGSSQSPVYIVSALCTGDHDLNLTRVSSIFSCLVYFSCHVMPRTVQWVHITSKDAGDLDTELPINPNKLEPTGLLC